MKVGRLAWFAMLTLCAVMPLVAQSADDSPAGADGFSAPAVPEQVTRQIIDHNIFLGDRDAISRAIRPPAAIETPTETVHDPAPNTPPSPPTPADADASLVLVGVTVLDGKATAFIEDRAADELRLVDATGPFSKGQITAIDLAGVTYVVEEQSRTIKLQQAFTGEAAAASGSTSRSGSSTPSSSGNSSATSATGDSPASSGTLSILERMRLRRQQEAQPSNSNE